MMKKLIMAAIALSTVAIVSCSDTTDRLGSSLSNKADEYIVTTDTFDVATRSIKVDSVLSRSVYSYIGRIKDPETGTYITSDYMTQFHILERQVDNLFPSIKEMEEAGATYTPVADSCVISIVVNGYQGDSLAAMKLRLTELAKPMQESGIYYTNFDPEEEGYLRTDGKGIRQNAVYSMVDLTESDSLRNVYRTNGYYFGVDINIKNDPYTDKNGRKYDLSQGHNYGTYIMTQYYEHPEYFKNSKAFARNVCPGFYFKCIDGLGAMTEVAYTQLRVYFHYTRNDTTFVRNQVFNATEEVLQTTHITNNEAQIASLVAKDTCTYLKTPAGIYTEVTLPIEKIKNGHEKDTLTSARIVFNRMNETSNYSDIVLEEPTTLLMVERDSLYSFFERNGVPNNKTSYLATFSSTYKTYTFNNISTLVNHMWSRRYQTKDWDKVVLIPVQVETTGTSTTTVSSISNEMNINSVRLVGGSNNKHQPVRISIIYNKNSE